MKYNLKTIGNTCAVVLFALAATIGFNGCGDVSNAPAPPVPPGALDIATNTLPSGSVGIFYDTTLGLSGGNAPYSWSLSSGSLPIGLTLASSGRISGTPTTIQNTSPTFRLQDSSLPTAAVVTKLLPMSITAVPQPTIITLSPLPNGVVNQPYPSTLVEAVGGTTPYTWSATVTPSLPSGLTFNAATQIISGTPTAPSSTTHTFSVTDSFSPFPQTVSKGLSLTVTAAPLTLSISPGPSLPGGTVLVPYSTTLAASGGTPPLTWDLNPGSPALPNGLQLSSAGVLSGTPTTAITVSPVFRVRDAATSPQQTATETLAISISLPAAPNITTTSASLLPNGTFNVSYTRTLQVQTGTGTSPFAWSFTGGSPFPNWLSLNTSTGVISGTPNATGTFNFNVQVTDITGQSDPTPPSLSITIVPQAPPSITPFTLLNGTVNQPYPTAQSPNIQLAAIGGITSYTWSVTPALPNGLQFNILGPGIISGTPLNASVTPTTHTFRVTDSTSPIGQFGELTRTLTINAALTIGTTSPLSPSGTVGDSYGPLQLSASGGTPPYTWSIIGGLLPAPGLQSLSSAGVISGTPSTDGSFERTYRVQDNNGAAVTKSLTLNVNAALTIDTDNTTLPLPAGIEGQPYSGTLEASGGMQPHTWSEDPLTPLPLSLSLNPSTGKITGAPDLGTAGTTSHNFTVQDSASHSVNKSLDLTITP